jgi:hypothetical protein
MWRRTSSFNSSVVSSEPSLNCTELSIINESIHPIIFTGNTNNIHNHSYDSLNDEEEEKIKLPIFKTSQLRLLNRFRNYRIPASYSVRSTSNVNCNFNCGTKHKMKKEKHLCCQTKNCEAEYLTTSCSVINKWKVFVILVWAILFKFHHTKLLRTILKIMFHRFKTNLILIKLKNGLTNVYFIQMIQINYSFLVYV